MNKVLALLFFLGTFFYANTSQAQCTPATSSFALASNQCLPVVLDGRPSTNEENHFIEIFEVDGSMNLVHGTYYSKWFSGEIGLINDLRYYTGYIFELGKTYRIKVAVQNYTDATQTQFCTQWDESVKLVTINSGATCFGPNMSLTPYYDFRQECIIGFAAGTGFTQHLSLIDHYVDRVEFNHNGVITVDNEHSYFYHMPSWGPFFGNISATVYYKDGTSAVRSMTYERCKTSTIDPYLGPKRMGVGETEDDITIYPNPSAGAMTISNLQGQAGSIEVYNVDGVRVFSKKITSTVEKIELDKVAKGIYMIHLNLENGQRIVKKHVIK